MLSDSCFDFLMSLRKRKSKNEDKALSQLIEDTARYGREPFDYGSEIGVLRTAAETYRSNPTSPLRNQLLRTAWLVMNYHNNGCRAYVGNYPDFTTYARSAQPEVHNAKTLLAWQTDLRR